MYTVYLADDEWLIREGLARDIPWEQLGFQLVGTAEDGEKLLKGVEENHPDVVLTDIRMPFLEGLDAIQKIRERVSENCYILVITGYSDFSYAQKAIKLGVYDFLLKPIDISNLCKVLVNIHDELDKQRQQKNAIAEMRTKLVQSNQQDFFRMVKKYMQKDASSEELLGCLPATFEKEQFFSLVLLQMDEWGAYDEFGKEVYLDRAKKFRHAILDASSNAETMLVDEEKGRFLVLFMHQSKLELPFVIRSFLHRLRGREDTGYTSITSPICEGILKIRDAYRFVSENNKQVFMLGRNIDYTEADFRAQGKRDGELPDIGRVIKSLATFDKKIIREDFDSLVGEIRSSGQDSYLYMHMMVSMVFSEITKLLNDIQCPIETIIEKPDEEYRDILICSVLDDMYQKLYAFVEKICDYMDRRVNANQSATERAKLYIAAHFTESDLTLEKVANTMGITSNYFSVIFKNGTGDSFINYLTKIRIEHAKLLLTRSSEKAYKIGLQCGYENATYFSTVFKRNTGLSPSEYREKNRKK